MDDIKVASSILLVMDYQTGIIARVSDADALVERTARLIESARRKQIAVGYVRVAFTDADYAAIPATNKSFTSSATVRALNDAAAATAIDERLAPRPGDIVVRKTRVGAFSTTNLHEQLKARAIDTLLLAGISTSGVVLSTLRAAADMDYRVFVVADCCADFDEEVHRVLLTKVFPRQADIITAADVAALTPA